MIFLDANILVSAILGTHTKQALRAALARDVDLGVTEAQLVEAESVLVRTLGLSRERAIEALEAIARLVLVAPEAFYATYEPAARARLHARGQPDWPVLAAALAADGGVWSHDRDFFGIGAPLWSTRNIKFAM